MVMNADDPTKVDTFSIVLDAASIGMRSPDNLDVGHRSLMVQEDTSSFSKIWRMDLSSGTWTHVATATQEPAETSGIVDVSKWFGEGWWAVSVQSHINKTVDDTVRTWDGPPGPAVGTTYQQRREDGQLLLLHVEGS